MKLRIICLALLSPILLSGCESIPVAPQIFNVQDRMTGNKLLQIKGNTLGGSGENYIVQLNVTRLIDERGRTSYSWIVDYAAPHWIFINAGDSLLMLVDGKRERFNGLGSSAGTRNVLDGGGVYEQAIYATTLDQIAKVAYAKDVQVRLVGSEFAAPLNCLPNNLEALRTFVETARGQRAAPALPTKPAA